VSKAVEVEKLRVVPVTRVCPGQQASSKLYFFGWISEISAGSDPEKRPKTPKTFSGHNRKVDMPENSVFY